MQCVKFLVVICLICPYLTIIWDIFILQGEVLESLSDIDDLTSTFAKVNPLPKLLLEWLNRMARSLK